MKKLFFSSLLLLMGTSSTASATPVSLYEVSSSPYSTFIARKPGDILTLIIEESAETKDDGEVKLERESDAKFSLAKLFFPSFNPTKGFDNTMLTGDEPGVEFSSESSFENKSENDSGHSYVTTMQIQLIEEVGNGQFVIQGKRGITLNGKDKDMFVSGVIRQRDITADNTIKSEQIANAVIEIDNKIVSKDLRTGWLSKIFNFIF